MSSSSLTAERPRPLPTHSWTQVAVTAVARLFARTLFSIEVQGRENIPAGEPCLLCANHTSHMDTFALVTASVGASHRLVFLGAHDYFSRLRWRRRLLRRIICLVEFDRRGTVTAAMHNLKTLGACREDGRIVVLFPEGTRSVDGKMATFKPGAALFAEKLNLRVIPCRIDGTHAALPKGRLFPRPRPLRVIFGRPQSLPPAPAGETGADRTARRAAFMSALRTQVQQLGHPATTPAPAFST
ncbi:MAG: 1-acyl-sn-glycerol-3-phosphate acyltransferase [Undibacterium sp.]|nr:1-acyl-sn-glycerol-3-phosphate acyltransferase [Opitutaceae bacterium]